MIGTLNNVIYTLIELTNSMTLHMERKKVVKADSASEGCASGSEGGDTKKSKYLDEKCALASAFDLLITNDAAEVLVLILGELATNAVESPDEVCEDETLMAITSSVATFLSCMLTGTKKQRDVIVGFGVVDCYMLLLESGFKEAIIYPSVSFVFLQACLNFAAKVTMHSQTSPQVRQNMRDL